MLLDMSGDDALPRRSWGTPAAWLRRYCRCRCGSSQFISEEVLDIIIDSGFENWLMNICVQSWTVLTGVRSGREW